VPWHRVIGSTGTISSRGPGTQGAQRQRDALVAEGVEVTMGRTGELRVDFGSWGWFPAPDPVGSIAQNLAEEDEDPT
jgi:methylated-DNA-protein-cysteine methyltransferase-like protein